MVALLATFTQLYFDYRHEQGAIEATFYQVAKSDLPTISNAVWSTNRKELQIVLDGLVQHPDVRYVAVMENDKILAQAGTPKLENIESRDYPLIHVHRNEALTIGSLSVVVDMAGVYQRLLDKFWVILVTNGIKTFLVAGFMLWLFHSLVTRHLQRIAEFSARLSPDNLDERLALDRPAHAQDKLDEFDLVVDGIARMQLNLSAAILTLEQRVTERTSQLEAVNRELEAFSYSVSHDLRAPLRSIDGFSQALAEDYGEHLDEVAHDYLSRVRRAAQRMGMLIDDLLRLARITRAEMHRVPVDLSAMAKEVAADIITHRVYGEVQFKVQADLVVYGDPTLLRILLGNLLDNAWKYSSKIESPLIEFGSTIEDGRTVYFVRDNGAGFDMDYVGKLFGAFQRLHRADEFPGTGIGLATVKRIVHRHGGKIWAEGQLGKGAIFKFVLTNYLEK